MALLDSSATAVVDSLQHIYAQALTDLARQQAGALDSLQNKTASLRGPLAEAQRDYQAVRARYEQAFARLEQFRSFGGNAIFSSEDAGVSTRVLLSEIADRSYKGRAFSLETEAEIRRYIQRSLQPIESEAVRAEGRLAHLKHAKSNRISDVKEIETAFGTQKEERFRAANQHLVEALGSREIATARVDSLHHYRFEKLPVATYYLYAPAASSEGFFVPVALAGHTRQDLDNSQIRKILVEAPLEKE